MVKEAANEGIRIVKFKNRRSLSGSAAQSGRNQSQSNDRCRFYGQRKRTAPRATAHCILGNFFSAKGCQTAEMPSCGEPI